jgi:hypothetical protein
VALSPEQREAAQRIGRQEADLRRKLSPEAQAVHADLAHARRQVAAWRERVRELEAALSEITGHPAPVAALAEPPPTSPPRRPEKQRPIDHARRAAQALWPQGDPAPDKLLLKTAVEDVNAWLAEEAGSRKQAPPRSISPDTVSRMLGRRK